MKLKFNFTLGAILAACAAIAAGCGHHQGAALPVPADGGDAQRLVSLLDYVGGDYGRAVQGGRVISQFEYEEQLRFVADARAMANALLGAGTPDDALLAALARVESAVAAKADSGAVAAACVAAREEAVTRFRLRTTPTSSPSLQQAEGLFAQNCAACHGEAGGGDGEQARRLDPAPTDFRDPERLAQLSPYRVYNALTFGVPGTAMASFEALSPEDRWSLAFYVFRLGHEGRFSSGPTALTLADMAALSDREILDAMRAEAQAEPEAALSYVRREAAFVEPPAGVGISRTRRLLRQALAAHAEGRVGEADRLVLDAYLLGFEPLEPRLRARDAEATLAIEMAFRDLRAALAVGEASGASVRTAALDRLLQKAGQGGRPVVPFATAFLIYFREGVEAALLVGTLLAGLRRLGRPDAARYLHAGWMAAIPAGVLTWFIADRLIAFGADQRELAEGVLALLAAAVLFSVSFWLVSKAESRHWLGYLRRSLEASLGRRNLLLLSGLAFLAVYREAAETVLFTQALLLESDAHRASVWAGAATGLAAVCAAAYLLAGTVLRLPLGPFFAVSGALLCGLAISFAGSGLYALVAAGYLPPRPVSFPEVPWLGIYPDLTSLLVQLTIVALVAAAALASLRRRPAVAAEAVDSVRREP
jgi:high-affinity iron transporter